MLRRRALHYARRFFATGACWLALRIRELAELFLVMSRRFLARVQRGPQRCPWLHRVGMGGCCAGVFRAAGGSAERVEGPAGAADSRAGRDPFLVIPPNVFGPLMECEPAQRGAVLAGAMMAVRRIVDGANPQLWGSGQQSCGVRFTFELRPSPTIPSGQELILESWEELGSSSEREQ